MSVLATSQHERYDSLFLCDYDAKNEDWHFDKSKNALGVASSIQLPYESEPKVLEYKFDFVSLVDDISKEIKFVDQIDFVVALETSDRYKERFYLQSLLVDDEGSMREIFGATHAVFSVGETTTKKFELIILEDLLNFLSDSHAEIARQKTRYAD